MIYMGSKNRIAKEILEIMLKDIGDNYFIDAFCGGGNLIQHATCKNKLASDVNKYTIAFLNKIKDDVNWLPTSEADFSKDDYIYIKNNKEEFSDFMLGHVGYNLSFGGKWFGGWCQNANRKDYVKAGYEHALRQAEKIKDITFINVSYDKLEIPIGSVVYCDIPYRGTTKYDAVSKSFDYDKFYDWCRRLKQNGIKIFVSEYSMPEDFKCVWQKEISMKLDVKSNSNKAIERLFTL
jgi:DNA adenine methylase